MIKESKYIIRRILIGVGIVLVLGMLNGCKVKAFSNTALQYSSSDNTKTYYDNNNYFYLGSFPYGSYTNYVYLDSTNIYFASTTKSWVVPRSQDALPDNLDKIFITTTSINSQVGYIYFFSDSFIKAYKGTYNNSQFLINYSISRPSYVSFNVNSSSITSEYYTCNSSTCTDGFRAYDSRSLNDYVSFASFPIYQSANSDTIIRESDSLPSSVPLIESLQPLKVNQEAYIVAYIFRPKFSTFDTDNFIYQYRVGKSGSWLNISQNEEQITINNNNIIYFRILDKSNNELVDSQTFTITDIGTLDNNLNYSIDFSTDYETLENSVIINKYFVNINYLPKSSNLKYQFQFVLNGSSLDNNNWTSLAPDFFSYNFETTSNGTLYARILDFEDNLLTTNTFTITQIGKIAINNNKDKNNNFFNLINSSIDFGGPISGIINIPINLILVLSSSIASNSCTNYNLGRLWGTDLIIPCVNIKQHLGDNLYSTIDLICACVMIYYIFKMFSELYTNLLFMQKNPIQDLGRRGD